MIISEPLSVAILAAASLADIPPVPTSLPEVSFPIESSSGVISSTRLIKRAWGLVRGSSVYKPSMSESRIRRSAPIRAATIADSLSLSPNWISCVETVSFSLTIGTAPRLKSSSKVFWALYRETSFVIVSLVKRTWAATQLYSENSFWYTIIKRACPTAA